MKPLSLGQKITAIFILVVVAQGLLLGLVSYQQATKLILQNKKADIADLVNRVDITVNTNVRFTAGQLESTAGNKILIDYLTSYESAAPEYATGRYLDDLAASFPAAARVLVCSPNRVLYRQAGAHPMGGLPMDEALQAVYRKAAQKQGEAVWLGLTAPFSSQAQGEEVIAAACAVQNPDTGKTLGMILLELDPQAFGNLLLNNQNIYQNQYTFIVDGAGRLISSSKSLNAAWVKQADETFASGLRRFTLSWNGKEYYACGQYNGLTGWVTFSMIAMDSILAQTRGLRSLIILFTAVCTLVASALILLVTYAATSPLKQLSAAMARTHEGDFSEQLSTRRRDEIGTLVGSFNFMVRRINELINEVYREKLAQKDAELEALQLQINPHFLYNTLDSINWMALEAGAGQVSRAVIALGNLTQYSLSGEGGPVRLCEELAYVESYLCIQKNRLEDRLRYEIHSSAEAGECPVPKLILQPIVENAITHGLEPKPEGGRVVIEALRHVKEVRIVVRDDGVGMDREKLTALLGQEDIRQVGHTCIGMQNVDKRLRLHYGEEYGLRIQSRPGRGTAVVLRIPLCGEEESE